MNRIHLKNINVFTNHGCLIEEEKIGSEYIVNLSVTSDLSQSTRTDKLEDTVDYVHLNHIVKEEMAIRSKLLEHVAQRIIDRIFREIVQVQTVDVSVAKVNPPIGGNVEQVIVQLVQDR